ncbi:MAG: YdcH family protein [Gammaproteobacteria bacterium]
MLGEKHHLAMEFPEYHDQIHVLKTSDPYFAELYQEYNDLDDQIRRIEEEIEVHADDYVEGLKLRRVHLKDELLAMLRKASA